MDKENEKENENDKKNKSRKIQRKWSTAEIKKLIELYEERQDLWDPSRPNYQNR